MKLYSYFRSSAAYRVRIALNLKGIEYEMVPVNLLTGEQKSDDYKQLNAEGLVPVLETDQGFLTQSLAMLEWLEEQYPNPSILPGDAWQKAQARSLAYAVSCDIHPVNNLRILKYLQNDMQQSDEDKITWYKHWINTGFNALEQKLAKHKYCCGDQPTIADICLVPQVFNALRFKIDMDAYPKISKIYESCNQLKPFTDAAPENQPDAS